MHPPSGDRLPHTGTSEGLERTISAEEARLAEELSGLAESWGALRLRIEEERDAEERAALLGKVDALWQKVLDKGKGPLMAYAGFTQLMAALLAGGTVAIHLILEKLVSEDARVTAIGEIRDLAPHEEATLQNLRAAAESAEGLRNVAAVGTALEQVQVFGLLVLLMLLKNREPKP